MKDGHKFHIITTYLGKRPKHVYDLGIFQKICHDDSGRWTDEIHEQIPIDEIKLRDVELTVPGKVSWEKKTIKALSDGEYIYGYRLQKERARFRKTGETFIKDDRLCRESEKIQEFGYLAQIYRFPIKDTIKFEQCKSRTRICFFEVGILSDWDRNYYERSYRGFPTRKADGWFDPIHMKDFMEKLMNALTIKSDQFDSSARIKIEINSSTREFRPTYANGDPISDDDLTSLMKWNREDYMKYYQKR